MGSTGGASWKEVLRVAESKAWPDDIDEAVAVRAGVRACVRAPSQCLCPHPQDRERVSHQHTPNKQAYAAVLPPERALSFGADGQLHFDMEGYIQARREAEAAASAAAPAPAAAAANGTDEGGKEVEGVSAALAGAAIES